MTLDKLLLAEEEMKLFKISTAKEIEVQKKAGVKRKKVGDTSAIDRSTGGAIAASSLAESSPKMAPGQKKARVEEGDIILLQIPHYASSYFDANFLEGIGP